MQFRLAVEGDELSPVDEHYLQVLLGASLSHMRFTQIVPDIKDVLKEINIHDGEAIPKLRMYLVNMMRYETIRQYGTTEDHICDCVPRIHVTFADIPVIIIDIHIDVSVPPHTGWNIDDGGLVPNLSYPEQDKDIPDSCIITCKYQSQVPGMTVLAMMMSLDKVGMDVEDFFKEDTLYEPTE